MPKSDVGRVIKTMHMLRLTTDDCYARRIRTQLNRGAQRNDLARRVFFDRSGEQRRTAQTLDARRYVTGQEINSVPKGALGFVLNVIVLWNTIHTYMDEARSHQTTANCAVPASRASRASRSLMTTCRTSRPFVTSTFASKDDIDSMFRRH